MSKLSALKLLLSKPVTVIKSGIIAQHENQKRNALEKEHGITQLPTIDLLDLFPDFESNLTAYSFLSGTSLITDILLLKNLASKVDNCEYLEIGSWRGESIAAVSEVAKTCTSLTLSAEEMKQLNFGDDFAKVHGVFSKGIANIKTVNANSFTFNFDSLNQKFDLIFIDGDHTYEGVLNDSKKTFSLRRNEKSVMVWHDYGNNPENVNFPVLKGILDGIPKEFHHNLYHVSNTVCAVYIENCDLPTYQSKFPTMPNKKFSIQVKAEKL